jgi:hypothetical protein
MKMHIMPHHPQHAATTTTSVSRQHLNYLCLGAGADLSEGLLDLEASLRVSLVIVFGEARVAGGIW